MDLYLAYRALGQTWAFLPFQVLYLEQRGHSIGDALDLNVVLSLGTVLFEVPTGLYADRYGRRRAMALGGLIMSVACMLFVAGDSMTWYSIANVLFALSITLSSGADSAYLYDYLAETGRTDRYARLEAVATAAKAVGNLAAVLVAGVIFAFAPAGVFVFTGVLTSAASVASMALPESHHPGRGGSVSEDLVRASQTLWFTGRLRATVLFGAATFVLLRMSLFTDQPHIEQHLTTASAPQLAMAAAALQAAKEIGKVVVAAAAGLLFRTVKIRWLVPALAVALVGVYAAMSFGIGALDVVLMVLLSSLFGLFAPLMRALMNRAIPSSRDRATLLSLDSMARGLLFAAVSPVFGRAVESSSLHAAFAGTAWVAAAVYLGLAVYALTTPRLTVVPSDTGGSAISSYLS